MYAKVENGQVVRLRQNRPSGAGWLPVEVENPDFDPEVYEVSHSEKVVDGDVVRLKRQVTPLPPKLYSTHTVIPSNGATAATVVYIDGSQPDGELATFEVNGSETKARFRGGRAALRVRSEYCGRVIVKTGGLGIRITVGHSDEPAQLSEHPEARGVEEVSVAVLAPQHELDECLEAMDKTVNQGGIYELTAENFSAVVDCLKDCSRLLHALDARVGETQPLAGE